LAPPTDPTQGTVVSFDVPRPEENNMRCSCETAPGIAVSFAFTCPCGRPDCPLSSISWESLLEDLDPYLPSDGTRLRSALLSFEASTDAEHRKTDRQLQRVMRISIATGMAMRRSSRDPFRTTIVLKRGDDQ
jgi:hypothetical protein